MIVMDLGSLLVVRPAIAKVVALENLRFLEQAYGAIRRGETDLGIDLDRAAVKLLDVRMIGRFRQHTGDQPPLPGHLEPFFDASPLDSRRLHHRPPYTNGP